MTPQEATRHFSLDLCARYPGSRPQDLLKALHQSVCGCGHFLAPGTDPLPLLRQELSGDPGPDRPPLPLDGPWCRIHLGWLETAGLSPETLSGLFALSCGKTPAPEEARPLLEEKLSALLAPGFSRELPFPEAELRAAAQQWRQEGFPPLHHSPAYRRVHRPAYRVIRSGFLPLLPLLAALDRRRALGLSTRLAIEGGSAAGKTTLASLLERLYGCAVFHMDDFFLRPEQRTEERLAQPGGNVDRERFSREVLTPLLAGEPVRFRRYDCHTRTLGPVRQVPPASLTVVEGAYSLHPELAEAYDLSVFLKLSPERQRARILARNDPETAQRFFSQWIPLEQAYFAALDPEKRCTFSLEVNL